MTLNETIEARMLAMADPGQAAHLMRFFKTGPGEYGEGDKFLGIRVPQTRAVVREFAKAVEPDDIYPLAASDYHEIRLAAFLLLIEIYKREKKRRNRVGQMSAVRQYFELIPRGNNWDLVDVVAPHILGDWVLHNSSERPLLHELAAMDGKLWHQRVGMVSCWTLIRGGEFNDALAIARSLITHKHDLIHKAAGWMLREIGKRGGRELLLDFLDEHASVMPRTMLRYSIEQLPEPQRQHYLHFT